jgi:hypothetical protein
MSDAKPTPGPYRIDEFANGRVCFVRDKHAAIIAEFYEGDSISHEETLANARAWVEGIAAMEKLERIRSAMESASIPSDALLEIESILDEAKP